MKALRKSLIVPCLLVNLFVTSMAIASEFPSDPLPTKGVEGPDIPRW